MVPILSRSSSRVNPEGHRVNPELSRPTRLRGVLLDLDGTLLDEDGAEFDALQAWLPSLGVPATPALHTLWGDVSERHLKSWRQRRITFREQRRRRLRDFLPAIDIRYAEDDLDAVFGGYLQAYEKAWRAFPDAADALAAIADAGLAAAVLTNGTPEQQRDKLSRTGLAARVEAVFTPDDLGVSKPDPAAFRGACAHWGLPPDAVLSVGDRHDLDVLPARAAGLHAVHLDRHDAGPCDDPHRIRSLTDLPAHLGQPGPARHSPA
jgi:putative hydrolase of the HAD superfamily